MKKRTTILTTLALTGLLFTGCAASSAKVDRIDLETAKVTAIGAAGFTADEVSFLSAELDKRNGIEYYDIDFSANGNEYDYDIDALTGEILSFDHDAEYYTPDNNKTAASNAPDNNSTTSSTKEISESEAKKIALAQVPGAAESDIREFEVDYDDGRLEYEGTIYYNHMEYEFEIDGYSGAIRNWDVESIYD